MNSEPHLAEQIPIVVPQKRTRILDAYGNFGENEPLFPGAPSPLDSWRTTNTSIGDDGGGGVGGHKARRLKDPASTGIRYKNGVPEYSMRSFFQHLNFAIPSRWDVIELTEKGGAEEMLSYRHIGELYDLPTTSPGMRRVQFRRPWRRRIFLLLTEPDTSVASAVFFFVLIISITVMNVVMMMQTMTQFQFTPDNCRSCGGTVSYMFDDETYPDEQFSGDNECVCPPTPLPWTEDLLKSLILFFSVEWVLRVVTFCPIPIDDQGKRKSTWEYLTDWFGYFTSWSTILDFLAIFPYYMELAFQTNGLMSLRLLRIFRVMQLIRLGQYNKTFMSLTAVLNESIIYLKLLIGVLLFAAAFFGSMIYWLEKGKWKYWPETDSYQFIRLNPQGLEEISPYKSIPDTFWWFFVTATTVGYGDSVPTSAAGKWVAFFAMMTGVLVIAFPVSVFSDLWSKELRRSGAFSSLDNDDEEEQDDHGLATKGNGMIASYENLDLMSSEKEPQQRTASHEQLQQSMDLLPPQESASPMRRGPSISSFKGNQVVMDREDLINILSHVQTIQESQREIKNIFRKYKIQIQSTSTHE